MAEFAEQLLEMIVKLHGASIRKIL
jgi:hypothetical protein